MGSSLRRGRCIRCFRVTLSRLTPRRRYAEAEKRQSETERRGDGGKRGGKVLFIYFFVRADASVCCGRHTLAGFSITQLPLIFNCFLCAWQTAPLSTQRAERRRNGSPVVERRRRRRRDKGGKREEERKWRSRLLFHEPDLVRSSAGDVFASLLLLFPCFAPPRLLAVPQPPSFSELVHSRPYSPLSPLVNK